MNSQGGMIWTIAGLAILGFGVYTNSFSRVIAGIALILLQAVADKD